MEDDLNFFQMEDNLNVVLGNLGSWFLVYSLILTQLDELWKTTSIFLKMEDDLNFFQMEDDLNLVLGNLGSWFLVCNIVSTQLDEI